MCKEFTIRNDVNVYTHISIDTLESVLVDRNQKLKVKIFNYLKKRKYAIITYMFLLNFLIFEPKKERFPN